MKERFDGTKELTTEVLENGYGVKTDEFSKIKDGIINTSYRITGEDGKKYVFRVYKQNNKTSEEIQFELDFMELLRQNGVPTPAIFRNGQGEKINTFSDEDGVEWKSMLMELAQGEHLSEEQLDVIPEFARLHARMHRVSAENENCKSEQESIDNVLNWMNDETKNALPIIQNDKMRTVFGQIVEDINNRFGSNRERIFSLPSGHTHLDYDSNNVIVKEERIEAIIDFDDMQVQPFCLDSAYSLWWWMFNNPSEQSEDILREYFRSYNEVRKLNDAELKMMPLFMRARNATLAPLLFVNNVEEMDEKEFLKALRFDEFLRENPLYFKDIVSSLDKNDKTVQVPADEER